MKEYILNLDRPRRLRYGFGAARKIREILGDKEINDILKIRIDEFPAIVWAGLTWEDPTLTIEQVEKMLDEKIPAEYSIIKIINIVTEAIAQDLGVESEKKVNGASLLTLADSPSPSESLTNNSSE